MKNELGTVIIGAGNIGNRHAEAILRVETLKLVGFYDTSKSACDQMAEKYGVKSYQSLNDAFADPRVEIADICTPPAYHGDAALKALTGDKHVIIEKPLVLNIDIIDEIEALAQSKSLKAAAISQHRFSKDALELKKMFHNQGLLGEVESFKVTVQRSRNLSYTQKTADNWKSNKAIIGGGVLLTIGIHYLDLACWLFGPEFEILECQSDVAAQNEVESRIYGRFLLNGKLGEVNGQWGDLPNIKDTIEIKLKGQELIFQGDYLVNGGPKETLDRCELHARQLRDFADSIRENRRPLVVPSDVRGALSLVFGLYQKAKPRE
jgi:UDP-N-acetyl-2-amino-2-deoxyglucuronate dehydrogenase